MKIGIISDTHRNKSNMDRAVEKLKDCDMIFHLGDNYKDIEYIKQKYTGEIVAIHGNCDTMKKLDKEKVCKIEGYTIFLTHGDNYGVNFNTFKLGYKAMEIGAEIVLYGHSHVASIEEDNNIKFINPGSVGQPRDGRASIAKMNLTKENLDCEIIRL
ncbi:MAG: metallophosphoesterase [Clostridium sp.]